MKQYLFVYGTLLADVEHPMGKFLKAHAQYLGPGRTSGRLFYIHHYPGLLMRPGREGLNVRGQLYQLKHPGKVLKVIDDYEEFGKHNFRIAEYRRLQCKVHLIKGGTVLAWVYIYRHSLRKRQPILSGDYLRFKGRTVKDKLLQRGVFLHDHEET